MADLANSAPKSPGSRNQSHVSTGSLWKLLTSSPDVICSIDEQGRFIEVSAASLHLWGYHPKELIGTYYMDLVIEKDQELTRTTALQIMNGKSMTNFENRYRHKNGSIVPILWSAKWDEEEKLMYCTAKDGSEKKRADLLLKEAQRDAEVYVTTLQGLIENVGDGFYFMDREFNVAFWNKQAELFLGKTRDEVIGRNIWDVFPHAKDLKFFEQYHKAINENAPVHFEEYISRLNSWLEVSAYPSQYGLSIFFKNITDKKKKEEELRIFNERYEMAAKATSDALWDWDLATNSCYFSDAFTELFGYQNKKDNLHKNWVENIHEEDKDWVFSSIKNALHDPVINQWSSEYRFYRKNGGIANVLDRGFIIRNEEGKAIRMVGSMQDITKLKEAELIREKKERKFKALIQSGTDLIALLDPAFNLIYVSSNYQTITGYNENELVGILAHHLVHPDDYSGILAAAGNILQSQKITLPPYRFMFKNGEYRWFDTTLSNHLSNPDINAIVVNTRDITEKKNAEAELQRLSLVAKETKNAVIITDPNEHIIWVNKAFSDISEYSYEEAVGRKPGELLQGPQTSLKTKQYLRECVANKQPFQCDILNYSKSGKAYWMEIKGQPVFDEKGEVKYFFAIQDDISERVDLQQMIVEEKIAAQKDIAKAIIDTQERERSEIGKELHDNVNQVLTTIKLYVENIRNYPELSDSFIDKSVGLTQRAINEIRFLAKQLVTPVMKDLGFEATITELVDHYVSMNMFDIHFHYEACEESIDKAMKLTIYRIIQEQLNNIVKYAKASKVQISIKEEKRSIKVEVKDNGIGFDTRKVTTGLGLSNIKNRAEVYRGKVNLKSAIGSGCCLSVSFPSTIPLKIVSDNKHTLN